MKNLSEAGGGDQKPIVNYNPPHPLENIMLFTNGHFEYDSWMAKDLYVQYEINGRIICPGVVSPVSESDFLHLASETQMGHSTFMGQLRNTEMKVKKLIS